VYGCGLVKGEGFAVDATVIEANASRYHGVPPDEADWSVPERQTRAVKEYIVGLDLEPNTRRRHIQQSRLRVRQGEEYLHLSGRQDADHDGPRQLRSCVPLSRLDPRL
jgi:hypothetical protein